MFMEKKVFKDYNLHMVNPTLFMIFPIFLGFVGEKDGKIILFVEFGGHGPFLCGVFFRSSVSQFIKVERFLIWISPLMLFVFPFLSKQNLWQCSVNSSLKLLNLASVASLGLM